ncbi:DUF124 domain protein, partial [Obelidium mucronatum]
MSEAVPDRPPPPVIPSGYIAAWSEEHRAYFYVNQTTSQSTWVIPTSPPSNVPPSQPPTVQAFHQQAPAPALTAAVSSNNTVINLTGTFQGGSYEVYAKPGTLVSYTQGIIISGTIKVSLKLLFAGESSNILNIRGPGEATISNFGLGDIIALSMRNNLWMAHRDAFLCMTQGIIKSTKAQSIGHSFGNTGLWVHQFSGSGTLFLETFGAIMHKDLLPGENYYVDQHFVVAWNCKNTTETFQNQGGMISMLASGEFWVCKFTGPGRVYFQTKSAKAFGVWLGPYVPNTN